MIYTKEIKVSLLGLLLGLSIIAYYKLILTHPQSKPAYIEQTQLHNINGTVEWIKVTGKYRDTIRFKFKEHNKYFVYYSSNGKSSLVKRILKTPNSKIGILANMARSHSPLFDSKAYHSVYEVKVNGINVVSYAEMRNAHISGFKYILWFGIALALIFGFLILKEIDKQQ